MPLSEVILYDELLCGLPAVITLRNAAVRPSVSPSVRPFGLKSPEQKVIQTSNSMEVFPVTGVTGRCYRIT